jgi:hypothetical protein
MTPHQLSDLTLCLGWGLCSGLGFLPWPRWWRALRGSDFAATFSRTEIDPDPLRTVRDGLEEE